MNRKKTNCHESGMTKLRRICTLPRNSFVGKAGRVIAVGSIMGFSALGPVNAIASEAINKKANSELTSNIGYNELSDSSNSGQDSIEPMGACEGGGSTFNCGDYKECTVDIGCLLDFPCESVQVPCVYGVYLPEL